MPQLIRTLQRVAPASRRFLTNFDINWGKVIHRASEDWRECISLQGFCKDLPARYERVVANKRHKTEGKLFEVFDDMGGSEKVIIHCPQTHRRSSACSSIQHVIETERTTVEEPQYFGCSRLQESGSFGISAWRQREKLPIDVLVDLTCQAVLVRASISEQSWLTSRKCSYVFSLLSTREI